MWPEHTVTYMPQLCVRKIKSSASSCKVPITLKICICKIYKEKTLQNNNIIIVAHEIHFIY